VLRIDPTASEPIVDQLVQGVKQAVASGEFRQGERLPSVRELARELTINPNTVSRAYERLESEGVILRRQGAGCFVAEQRTKTTSRERKRQLAADMRRLVTDAFHRGSTPDELSEALARELKRLHYPEGNDSR